MTCVNLARSFRLSTMAIAGRARAWQHAAHESQTQF